MGKITIRRSVNKIVPEINVHCILLTIIKYKWLNKKTSNKVFLTLILWGCKYKGRGSPKLCEAHSLLCQIVLTLDSDSPKSRPRAVFLSPFSFRAINSFFISKEMAFRFIDAWPGMSGSKLAV